MADHAGWVSWWIDVWMDGLIEGRKELFECLSTLQVMDVIQTEIYAVRLFLSRLHCGLVHLH